MALLSRISQKTLFKPPPLTVGKVFQDMVKLAKYSGNGSQKDKKVIFGKLLVAACGDEAKFLVRTLQGKLRIGIQHATILQSIAWAFSLSPLEATGEDG